MFGHRYYGRKYYGARYWGDGGSGPPPPPVIVAPTQGMGPGWNLFVPPHTKRIDRSREEIEDEIRSVLDRADVAETKRERREAVREIKEIVADVAATPSPNIAAMVREMESAAQFHAGAIAYLDAVGKLLASERAQELANEQDDYEALLLIMETII